MDSWLLDMRTAQHLVDNSDKFLNTRFFFETCPYCGANYFEALGHDCDNVIEIKMHDYKHKDFILLKGGKDERTRDTKRD